MNHTNNQNQSHQNNTIPLTVIDLTKENASKATNARYSISPSKKQRRPEITNESTDIRPQKRSRIEQVQEHKTFFQGVMHLSNNREILPTPRTPTQTSIETQSSCILQNNPILPPPLNYSQYVPHSQNFNMTSPLNGLNGLDQPYNIGMINPTVIQIPPVASNPSPSSFSSTSSRSPNQNSQEVIDLTNDSSDDNDCVIDEKETNRDVCWGMIDTEVIILYPRPCSNGKGEEEVQLRRESGKNEEIRVIKDYDYVFGVVEVNIARILIPLMDNNLVWTEATIPKNWASAAISIPLHIMLYGRPSNTKAVSTHLYERRLFLKDPIVYNVETRYSNPHTMSGNVYSNKINQIVYKGYSGGSFGTTRSSEDIKNKMNKVFNSLMTADNMPELDPDQRLITTLYKHQKQALYFLVKREQYNDFTNDQTNELMSLWRTRISAGRHLVYYNIVTNLEVHEKPVQMRGGIIADDMGLGKTIQMIALILGTQKEAVDFAKKPSAVSNSGESSFSSSIQSGDENSIGNFKSKGTLIICPLSTVANWEEQLVNHVQEGALNVYVYHGGSRTSDPSHLINYDIVITTYNVTGTEFSKQSKGQKNQQSKIIANDSESTNSPTPSALQQIHWFRIILDEAHIIKDVTTVQSQAACSLKAERRWCLTGTPIQNKVEDLFALIKFLHMDPFSDKEKWKQYILRPIKSIDPDGINRLQTLMKCITLRRTKTLNGKSLLALPPRNDHIRYLELSDHERRLYEKMYNYQSERVRKYTEENNIMRHYVNILQALLRLRQICAHYSLVKESEITEDLDEEIVNEGLTSARAMMLLSIVRDSGMDQCGSCLQELVQTVRSEREKTAHSTKVKALIEDLVQAKEEGVKSVVFSQWTKMLDLIEDALKENDIIFTRLDGTMSRAERTQNMDTFKQKDKVSVILVSLKAGGVGLNLTAAQRAYLMDPFWNPSVENQAIDRIHRLGQTCAVDTVRFIIKDSIEEGILQLQERKLRLAELTLSEKLSKQDITRHRLEDLKVLFK
ncbi:hypothetical protein RhiirA4_340782 [Rhizophagus irregularis]|uniref:Uncharacterized protein n=1 Tax=Rhizophagus irregularis TaxID=588596 RepID=A0A2I1G925_9GLOM|nr:hypothetical protein RhiirA4_340782 [Rhizophagus irregularis]